MYAKLQKFLRLSKDFGLWFSVRYYYLRETKRYNEYIDFIQSKLVDILRPVITKYSDYECNPHDLEKKQILSGYAGGRDLIICRLYAKCVLSD